MLIKIIFSVVAVILFTVALDSFLGQSEVSFRCTTKECVKVINFFKGNLARAKLEKTKTSELSWYIEDENNKDEK